MRGKAMARKRPASEMLASYRAGCAAGRVLAIDPGPRNLGLCVLDGTDPAQNMLKLVDIFKGHKMHEPLTFHRINEWCTLPETQALFASASAIYIERQYDNPKRQRTLSRILLLIQTVLRVHAGPKGALVCPKRVMTWAQVPFAGNDNNKINKEAKARELMPDLMAEYDRTCNGGRAHDVADALLIALYIRSGGLAETC